MVASWPTGMAQAEVTRELPLSLLGGVLLLVAALAASAVVIIWVGRWIKRPTTASGDDLSYYRLLYEQGEFSREEYERIRAKLGQRLRQELDLPGPGQAPPPGADSRESTDIRVGPPLPPPSPPAEPPGA